mgnify:FL=1
MGVREIWAFCGGCENELNFGIKGANFLREITSLGAWIQNNSKGVRPKNLDVRWRKETYWEGVDNFGW